MRQALHILKKDAFHLRWELGLSVVFLAMLVYTQVDRAVLRGDRNLILTYLLLSFWAFLCARLIQAEPIPGDRQFWVTRPYQWRSLLGAKLLFVAVFIGVPLLTADAVVLALRGFSIAAHLGGLLWSLLLIGASALLAFCALATLTRGLAEWMLSAAITFGALFAVDAVAKESAWGGVEWIRGYGCVAIVFVAALVVFLGQYKRRRTVAFAVVLGAGLLGSSIYAHFLNPALGYEMETRFSKPKVDPSPIRITAIAPEPAVQHPERYFSPRTEMYLLAIPVEFSGLGDGQDLISDEVRVVAKNENGETLTLEGGDANNHLEHLPNGYRITLRVPQAVFEKAKGGPVQLSLTLYLTLLGQAGSRVLLAGGGPADLPGVGRCRDFAEERESWIVCESPLRAPSNLLVVNFDAGRRDRFMVDTSYSPFPADSDSAILPLGQYYHSGPRDFAPATLTSLEPLAHFRRDLNLSGVSLANYQVLSRF